MVSFRSGRPARHEELAICDRVEVESTPRRDVGDRSVRSSFWIRPRTRQRGDDRFLGRFPLQPDRAGVAVSCLPFHKRCPEVGVPWEYLGGVFPVTLGRLGFVAALVVQPTRDADARNLLYLRWTDGGQDVKSPLAAGPVLRPCTRPVRLSRVCARPRLRVRSFGRSWEHPVGPSSEVPSRSSNVDCSNAGFGR